MKQLAISDEFPLRQIYVVSEVPDTLPEKPVLAYCRADKNLYISDTTEWRRVATTT